MEFYNGYEKAKFSEIIILYNSVGWSAYTDKPEDLKIALKNSTYITYCEDEGVIVGLARSISDRISIHYLQDILVKPEYQGKGIGKNLLERCLKKFKNVRTHMILTDDEDKQKLFYESLGFKNTKSLREIKLNSFIKLNSINIKYH